MPKNINIKCGIEIHKQIEGKKLFCNCLAIIRDDPPAFNVTRYIRTSAGESGRYDLAALYEAKKGKHFIYQGYNDTTCLVELDEKPPQEINHHALEIALQVCLLLNCKINNVVQVMRKIVIDGSNTSGFQRTMLIGKDGYINVNNKKIGIQSVCLEEEASQIIERTEEYDVYNLSRLGIPLVEIATSPDINSPEECKIVAEKIGMILNSIEGIKRGIGSIRQDINISINDNPRIEIKGFQELKYIPKVIENEIERQMKLLKQKQKIKSEVRKANPDGSTEFLRPMPGSARMYPETDINLIELKEDFIKSVKLPELIAEKVEKLVEKYKISSDYAREIIEKNIGFEKFLKYKLDPQFIAKVLVEIPKEIKSRFNVSEHITDEDFKEIFALVESKKITKEAVPDVLVEKLMEGKIDLNKFKPVKESDIEKEIKGIIKKNKGASLNALMGLVMEKFRGKIEGKKIAELIKKLQ